MKNHKEFRDAVFEKAAAYEKQKKLRRQKALRIGLSVCVCLAVFIAITAVPFGIVMSNMDEANSAVPGFTTAPDNDKATAHTSAATTSTEATTTTAATTCTTVATTCATTAGTFATTTIATTCTTLSHTKVSTTASTTMAPEYTYATTTTEVTATTTLETTGPIFPEQLLGDYYHNGVMTLHLTTNYGYSDDCHIANIDTVFDYSDLSEAEAKYFDETYFEENSVIRIKYTLGNTGYRLDYQGMQTEDGKITVFLELDRSQSNERQAKVEWELIIGIPRELAKDAMIVADVEEK